MVIRKYIISKNYLNGTLTDITDITNIIWNQLSFEEQKELYDRNNYIRYFVHFCEKKIILGIDFRLIDSLPKCEFDYLLPRIQRMGDDHFMGKIIYKNSSNYFTIKV